MSEQAEWQRCVEESGLSAETALVAMAALETMPKSERNQGLSTPLQKRMWKAWSALQEENNKHKEVPNPTEEEGEQESDGEAIDFTLSKRMHFCHSYLCNFACHIFNIFCCSHDISTKPIFDISRSSNYSSEIYQTIPFPIYLARVIT